MLFALHIALDGYLYFDIDEHNALQIVSGLDHNIAPLYIAPFKYGMQALAFFNTIFSGNRCK